MLQFKTTLRPYVGRANSLNGLSHLHGTPRLVDGKEVPLGRAVADALNAYYETTDSSEAIELIKKAHAGDKEAAHALNGLRIEQANNYIYANMNFGGFFRVQTLKKDERPVVQNWTMNELSIAYIGQDGRVKVGKIERDNDEILIPLKRLGSDDYGYRLEDIYNGDITGNALATVNIGYDMTNKVDALGKTLLDASAYAAFITSGQSGRKSKWTFNLNSRINTGNLPTTNDVTLLAASLATANLKVTVTENTTSTKFRLDVIRTIMAYTNAWGAAFASGPIAPTGKIIVPSADTTQLSAEITPTGTTNNPIANQIMADYTNFDYMGVRWTLIPDNTLEPGVCYPILNKPVGTLFTKPEMDQDYDEVDRKKNWGTRSQSKVLGFYINEMDRVNALRIRYRTA